MFDLVNALVAIAAVTVTVGTIEDVAMAVVPSTIRRPVPERLSSGRA